MKLCHSIPPCLYCSDLEKQAEISPNLWGNIHGPSRGSGQAKVLKVNNADPEADTGQDMRNHISKACEKLNDKL